MQTNIEQLKTKLRDADDQLDNSLIQEQQLAELHKKEKEQYEVLAQQIAAGIIGYIRQAALGGALVPFAQRVQNAMQSIYSLQSWTPVQRK